MKNFSEMNIISGKEQVVNAACSKTGLNDTVIGKLYESAKLDGKSDQEIIDYFNNITLEKIVISSQTFLSEISELIKESVLTPNNQEEKHKQTFKFLSVLNELDNEKKIDSVSLIDTINNVLIINDVKAKSKLIPILELPLIELNNFHPINESFELQSEKNENTVILFEGLKHILNKNNKRWGVTYHIQNSYNAIMNYIDTEIQEIQLNSKMYSVSNDFHLALLNDMLSGNVDPLNKNLSSVKQLIPDLQTVVFDMVLIVNQFIESNSASLEYVKRQTFNEYKDSANSLIISILSSINNSLIIEEETKKQYLKSPENMENVDSFDRFYGKNVLSQLTQIISHDKLKYNTWNIGLKSVVDMLNFVKSSSIEFNMNIRPILRTYITKSYELTSSLEKANSLLKKQPVY